MGPLLTGEIVLYCQEAQGLRKCTRGKPLHNIRVQFLPLAKQMPSEVGMLGSSQSPF